LKQWLDFSNKKGLQLWSDFHQVQAKEALKQRLDFPHKKGLQLWSDLVKFKAENL